MTNYGGTETGAATKQCHIMRSSSSFRRKWSDATEAELETETGLRTSAQLSGRDGSHDTPRPQQLRLSNLFESQSNNKENHNRQTVRWGIAPVTLLAEDFVTALSVLPPHHHCITSCVDAYRSQGLTFADKHQVLNVFTSFEELARCSQVDAVYISPSNPMHCELCHLMLNHDKHVLCEQPLCMTEDQVVNLVAKAQARGLFLMEGIWSRCLPAYRMLREELRKAKLGTINQVECTLGWELSNKLSKMMEYAGVTKDLAPYAIQLALWIFREVPASIRVSGKINNDGIDVAATIDMIYKNNRTARLTLSTEETLSNMVIIRGSKGKATMNNLWCPELVVLNNEDHKFTLPRSKEPTIYHNRIGLCYEAEEVRQCILKGRTETDLFNHNESRLLANLTNQVHEMLCRNTHQNRQEVKQIMAI